MLGLCPVSALNEFSDEYLMYQTLLIEDSPDYQLLITKCLGSKFNVILATSLKSAREEIARHCFDVMLVDVVLPDGDGIQFCSELMRSDALNKPPLILLTGKTAVNDRVLGWSVGADDYITKPFDPFELQVRIESRIQKSRLRSEQGDYLHRGKFRLNAVFHEAVLLESKEEKKLNLTPNEFRLLHCLMKNQDRVLSRNQLLQFVWGSATHITDRTIDKHISSLRQKLEVDAKCIVTVPGLGYRFSVVDN